MFSRTYPFLILLTIFLATLFAVAIVRYLPRYPERREDSTSYETPRTSSTTATTSTSFSDTLEPFVSRYTKDFETISCLGRGGFGVVFEAKQRIDECGYAIKRITLPSETQSRDRVLREVKALAKLDHNNIVRYSTSWVENPPPGWSKDFDSKWIDDASMIYSGTEEPESVSQTKSQSRRKRNTSTVIKIDELRFDDDIDEKSDFEICFENSEKQSESSSENVSNVTNSITYSKSTKCSRAANVYGGSYLYIQMQLCEKKTLKEWLTLNSTRQKNDIRVIYNQIISAVEYIHSQQLIHRDLKPSNIFFSSDGNIKVGDFGLVTFMKSADCENNHVDYSERNHTKGAGTFLYMSPEQINGQEYSYKVDIYSSAVILFELLISFSTEMERHKMLTELRQDSYPSEFNIKYPKEHKLLKKMLAHKPSDRPDAVHVKIILDGNDSESNGPSSLPTSIVLNS